MTRSMVIRMKMLRSFVTRRRGKEEEEEEKVQIWKEEKVRAFSFVFFSKRIIAQLFPLPASIFAFFFVFAATSVILFRALQATFI